jgi:hypothetical protein
LFDISNVRGGGVVAKWCHAAAIDMELGFGVELVHTRGDMEWLGKL